MFSFIAYANLATRQNFWRLNSQISQDGTFVHYPFLYWTFLYLLSLIGIFFHYLFFLTYFDSLQWHKPKGIQIVRAKMTSLNAIFCRGNKLSSRSLARFCCRKHKKFTAQASCSWKILSSTCRQVYGTMYNSSKLCMHLLCSAFMLRNLQWIDHLTFEGVVEGDFRTKISWRLTSREKNSCKEIPSKKIPTLKIKLFHSV